MGMKSFWKFASILMLSVSLWGCGKKQPNPPKLVSGIYITGTHQDAPVSCFYAEPRKMETILYYLRSLEDLGKPKLDPERIMGDYFKITVFYSDGSQKVYRQQADRFLSRNDRPWQKVDARRASMLYPLMKAMPTDQETVT